MYLGVHFIRENVGEAVKYGGRRLVIFLIIVHLGQDFGVQQLIGALRLLLNRLMYSVARYNCAGRI